MISIRKYLDKDAEQVASVISRTFRRFNHNEGNASAVRTYLDWYDVRKQGLDKISKGFSSTSINYVCLDGSDIIGIVRGTPKKLINLFVLGEYHGKGLGRKLLDKFEEESYRLGSRMVSTNASLYAVPFYQSRGYKKTTGVRNFRRISGLKVQPMRKVLKK